MAACASSRCDEPCAATGALLGGLGVAGLPFRALLAVKAGFCGALGYLVAR